MGTSSKTREGQLLTSQPGGSELLYGLRHQLGSAVISSVIIPDMKEDLLSPEGAQRAAKILQDVVKPFSTTAHRSPSFTC